jgi:hypothetical protein
MFRFIYPRLKIISPYAPLPYIPHSHPLTYHKGKLNSYLYIRLNASSYVINSIPNFRGFRNDLQASLKDKKEERSEGLFFHDGEDEKNIQKNQEFIYPFGHELRLR